MKQAMEIEMEMMVEKNENELFYGNQKNISCSIWKTWFEINATTLNDDFNINIWLIAATLLVSLLMVYIFYVPVYWMKVKYCALILLALLPHFIFHIFTKPQISFSRI